MSLKQVINGFYPELEEKAKTQDEAYTTCRRILTLSKQAIAAIHRDEQDAAKVKLNEAKQLLEKADNTLIPHPDLRINLYSAAQQEYAEAEILLKLVQEREYVKPVEIGIPTIPYLLGLADVVGELRRQVLESLRKNKLKKAEYSLQKMDEIYIELMALESAHSITSELRPKCDTARRLIEITTGEITTEKGRRSLEQSIRQLEKKLAQS